MLLAGENFGCGSSREQPVLGLKAVGIAAVVAKSFARIFYRAAINQGLVLVEAPAAVDAYKDGDEVALDVEGGKVTVGGTRVLVPAAPAGDPGHPRRRRAPELRARRSSRPETK